jgi:hypothetical protein
MPKRKIAALHYSSTSEGSPGFAGFTLVLFNGGQPIMFCTLTFSAYNTFLIPHFLEFQLTGCFIRKVFNKFD